MVIRKDFWYKLIRNHINVNNFIVMRSMYHNVKFCVMVEQHISDTFICNVGMREGESLSLLLATFDVNAIHEHFIKHNCCN